MAVLVAISGCISGYWWLLAAISEFHQDLIFTNFGRTDLRKGVSGAKFDGQADFEVHLAQISVENFAKNFFRRRKMKCRGSSATRFEKVLRQSEPCLRGKRPFKVSRKNRKLSKR